MRQVFRQNTKEEGMRTRMASTVVVAGLVLGGCSVGTVTTDTASEASAHETAKPLVARVADWKVSLKVTDKQCFGSAGCNVTVEPKVRYVGSTPKPTDGSVSLTYRISGDTSGAVIQTVDIDLSTDTYPKWPVFLSTDGATPKATVTEVEVTSL